MDKEWDTLQNYQRGTRPKLKSEPDVINEAKVTKQKSSLRHNPKYSELAEHLQPDKGLVVWRGENVQDDAGGFAHRLARSISVSIDSRQVPTGVDTDD